MNDIDFVFPYVDNKDPKWTEAYFSKRKELDLPFSIKEKRFRTWDNLRFLFRGIAKFMPWIRKVHMIVSNPEQVPEWVDTEQVHIVCHKDFIPEEFLPTFNSCTIEMFLNKIPELSERFIYGNDDMFITDYLNEEDFFINNIPKIKMKKDSGTSTMFKKVEYGSQKLVADYLKIPLPNPNDEFLKVEHTIAPMVKETLNTVSHMMQYNIYNSCTPFREEKNYNQYIYTYYQYLSHTYLDSERTYTYFAFKNNESHIDKADSISDAIKARLSHTICINDNCDFKTEEEFNYIKNTIGSAFSYILPDLCKYEKTNYVEEKTKDWHYFTIRGNKVVFETPFFSPKEKDDLIKAITMAIKAVKAKKEEYEFEYKSASTDSSSEDDSSSEEATASKNLEEIIESIKNNTSIDGTSLIERILYKQLFN